MTKPIPASVELYARLTMRSMDGWCGEEKAIALAMCVIENKPALAVEIGVYAGRSLIAIALAMKETGVGKVIGIDPWDKAASISGFDDANKDWWGKLDHSAIKAKCEASIDKAAVRPYVELIQATNKAALPGVVAIGTPIGLLSIDGNHSPEQSCFDVANYAPLVPAGGFVFFDDVDWDTTQEAIRILMQTCALKEVVGNCGVFVKH